MGIDFHAFNFLRYVASLGPFGDTITIGRQELAMNPVALASVVKPSAGYVPSVYCDNMLVDQFGASRVESIDNCDYEDATHVLDLCQPIPPELQGRYDMVIDAGTTEHIFNAPQALKSISQLARPGGRIVHILPANNYCGHGFWQFSPELFFSLYSEKNGYRDTQVFLASLADKWRWFKVKPPRDGKRVNVLSLNELHVMVHTVRAGESFSHENVQQSDYVYEWATRTAEPEPIPAPSGLKARIMNSKLVYDTLFPLYHRWYRLRSPERMSERNPGLTPFDVRSLGTPARA